MDSSEAALGCKNNNLSYRQKNQNKQKKKRSPSGCKAALETAKKRYEQSRKENL